MEEWKQNRPGNRRGQGIVKIVCMVYHPVLIPNLRTIAVSTQRDTVYMQIQSYQTSY